VDVAEHGGVEEPAELVDGERDQPGRGGGAFSFSRGGDDEERVGEHREGRPAVPGGPAPDLVLVKAGQALTGLEGLLDTPALPGHPHQGHQGHRARCVAAVVGQMVLPSIGIFVVFGVDADPGPS
jgi:hypothetical protein